MDYLLIKNHETVSLSSIPVLEYENFLEQNTALLGEERRHCVNYYGFPQRGKVQLICCIADDADGTILVSSAWAKKDKMLPSFTARRTAFHNFEREIHENFGLS